MNCDNCKKDKTIKLYNNNFCCNFCKKWILECEAKYILSFNLNERREMIKIREKKRINIDNLKKEIINIHFIKTNK